VAVLASLPRDGLRGPDLLKKIQWIERAPQGAHSASADDYVDVTAPPNRVREIRLPRAGGGIDVGRIEAPARGTVKCPAYR
jgi:hypothetical protein